MWKKLSEELPKSVRGVLYNERDDEVYVMDLPGNDDVAYVISNTHGKWSYVVIKPCDYDQWWWCELSGHRN